MPLPKSIVLSMASKAMLEERNDVDSDDRIHLGLNAKGNKFVVRLHRGPLSVFGSRWASYWAEATPGAEKIKKQQHIPGDYWSLHVSDFSVLRIANTWRDDQITYEDELTALTYANCYMRFIQGEANARRIQDWLDTDKPVTLPIACKEGTTPNTYQTIAAYNAMTSPAFGFLMEQGTGKTFPSILTIAHAAMMKLRKGGFYRGMIVCPVNVRLNWQREIEKFSPIPLRVEIVEGTLGDRIGTVRRLFVDAVNEGATGSIAIVSYKSAGELCNLFRALGVDSLDICVVDESHTIKNPTAAITKEMLAASPMFTKRCILTGTPVGNSPHDLWAQLEFLYPGCSGFVDYASFKKYYSRNVPPMASSIERLEAMLNMPLLRERLARNCFIVTKKKALPFLPDMLFDVVSIKLSKHQKRAYESLAKELALSIESDLKKFDGSEVDDSGEKKKNRNIVIQNALTKSLKLTQITSGFVKWDAEKHPVTGEVTSPAWFEDFLENPKVDWLVEQIKEAPITEKFIVWACQTRAQDLIMARLAKEGIKAVRFNGDTTEEKRTEAIDTFNDEALKDSPGSYDPTTSPKTVRVFVGNQRAAGPGLNLLGYPIGRPELSPCNACRVVRYVYTYSYIDEAQSDARAHRVGTRVPIRITTLIGSGTVEKNIHAALEAKRSGALEMTDVRDILKDLTRGISDD